MRKYFANYGRELRTHQRRSEVKFKILTVILGGSIILNIFLYREQLKQRFIVHNISMYDLSNFKLAHKVSEGGSMIQELGELNKNEKTLIYTKPQGYYESVLASFRVGNEEINVDCGSSDYGLTVRLIVPPDPRESTCFMGNYRVID